MKKIISTLVSFVSVMIITYAHSRSIPPDGPRSSTRLDNATIRCYYQFTRSAKKLGKPVQQVDTMTLDIGPLYVRYYDQAKLIQDSAFANQLKTQIDVHSIQSISVLKNVNEVDFNRDAGAFVSGSKIRESAQLFRNRQTGEMFSIDEFDDHTRYKSEEKATTLPWIVASDTATVLDYSCQKASVKYKGRNYEAWFSPEMAINEGPWKLFGLPGLIMKANDTEGMFSFQLVGIEKLDPPVEIAMPAQQYINCTPKDLAKAKKRQGGITKVIIKGSDVTIMQKKGGDDLPMLDLD